MKDAYPHLDFPIILQLLQEAFPANFDHVSGAAAQNNGPCSYLSSGEISPTNFAQNYFESQNNPVLGAAAQTHASITDTSEYFVHTGDCNTYHNMLLQSMHENFAANSTVRWSAEPLASDASQRTAPRRNPTRPWRRQRWSAAKAMP